MQADSVRLDAMNATLCHLFGWGWRLLTIPEDLIRSSDLGRQSDPAEGEKAPTVAPVERSSVSQNSRRLSQYSVVLPEPSTPSISTSTPFKFAIATRFLFGDFRSRDQCWCLQVQARGVLTHIPENDHACACAGVLGKHLAGHAQSPKDVCVFESCF